MSSDSGCKGVYVPYMGRDGGRCYTYDVLQRMCLLIAYREHPETASYSWEYVGGCYKGGEVAVYEPAELGKTYDFTFVPIEVREDDSIFNGIANTGAALESGLSFFSTLSRLFFFLALLSGIAFGVLFFLAWRSMQSGTAFEPKKLPD